MTADPAAADRQIGLGPARERAARQALEAGASVTAAARICGLSRSYFIRAFRETTGLPPHRWKVSRRLEAARDLLVFGGQTIAEIASDCGFADQSHLSRSFRERWGVSPARFRRASQHVTGDGDH